MAKSFGPMRAIMQRLAIGESFSYIVSRDFAGFDGDTFGGKVHPTAHACGIRVRAESRYR